MCGIVGYIGDRQAADLLIDGLLRLEYRGYDSAGIAVQNGRGVYTRKIAGRVAGLQALVEAEPLCGTSGIGHTRWATHGAPTQVNAHPHIDCTGEIAVVHNGIIENGEALRIGLERAGHKFRSETDTETLAHLIEEATGATLEDRVKAALAHVIGTYGVAVMSSRDPGKLVVARQGSPVLIGVGNGENFVASDAAAVLRYTRSVVYLDDGDLAVVTADGYTISDRDACEQERAIAKIDLDLEEIELGGYPHFMLKEILEQPRAVLNAFRGRLLPETGSARLDGLNLSAEECAKIQRIIIVGCGTSWHAGLIGRSFIEHLSDIPVQVEYASEFRCRTQRQLTDALVIAISQSGETADTLEAMRSARKAGARVIGLVNAVGSTIAREADGGIYLHAGPEIGVASTKAFTTQLAALLLLGLYLGRQRDLTLEQGQDLLREIARLPRQIDEALKLEPQILEIAKEYADSRNFLYLGRGTSFAVALEGALKLKEVSYIHAEGYPAAEMKHGPIALVDSEMPVVFIAPADQLYAKILSNISEVRARGGRVLAITTEGNGDLSRSVHHQLRVPATLPLLSSFVTVIPLQLLAYHIAVLRGCDVDRPRNLAKSVTVE
jgi:glucosamine--fructose-6-phosphate aminotransferase (isomerizing)